MTHFEQNNKLWKHQYAKLKQAKSWSSFANLINIMAPSTHFGRQNDQKAVLLCLSKAFKQFLWFPGFHYFWGAKTVWQTCLACAVVLLSSGEGRVLWVIWVIDVRQNSCLSQKFLACIVVLLIYSHGRALRVIFVIEVWWGYRLIQN